MSEADKDVRDQLIGILKDKITELEGQVELLSRCIINIVTAGDISSGRVAEAGGVRLAELRAALRSWKE